MTVYKISWRDIMLIMFMEMVFFDRDTIIYPLEIFKIAIENGPSIVDLPMINDVFP